MVQRFGGVGVDVPIDWRTGLEVQHARTRFRLFTMPIEAE